MANSWRRVLWAIALVVLLLGICGAFIRGFWGVSHDCHSWANSNGYQVLQDNWWAKSGGCVAAAPGGSEVVHSEGIRSKATGWAWQFGIFAVGTLPVLAMIIFVSRRAPD